MTTTETPSNLDTVQPNVVELAAAAFSDSAHDGKTWSQRPAIQRDNFRRRMQVLAGLGLLAAPGQYIAFKHLHDQIDRLATFIVREIPGEPSQSEGAVDTAIRLIRTQHRIVRTLDNLIGMQQETIGTLEENIGEKQEAIRTQKETIGALGENIACALDEIDRCLAMAAGGAWTRELQEIRDALLPPRVLSGTLDDATEPSAALEVPGDAPSRVATEPTPLFREVAGEV